MNEAKWIDISQPLDDKLAHWPGDTPFQYVTEYTKEQTGSVNIGKMTTSLHSGTHVDAPFHFDNSGARILDLDLELFIGQARVIDGSSFTMLNEEMFSHFNLDGVTRLLVKTLVPNNPIHFPADFPSVTTCGANYLGKKGVKLIGVDVPSVDHPDSKELSGHHALLKNEIAILENVMLDSVPDGDYELIALPLPIKEGDGSPVRAVIRPLLLDEKGE
ncbi:kynurenine formamidase [Alkalihalobacillus alcalophilus ATCC 27647 = CGMCC 1.3604]|uniref:Kynurenine formamidase n=1 Tax=Alkalihalobacillus alcalophilus ATCC 27647 = CGMCC 1.3604 TaxID=1218173 RepID=A0A094WK96_ALKAL|nr:arylformamidase [Alkalihalobacillus alcalophilus]KGA96373.1 kynurenine formamidase [Alkalihalobacillus alcalophilus ATCC 27647 = CGMCC 1.3604]MED1563488.1 arylformamidase [Alkalihalobacillus alcalophilus]THG90609.1 kynurenine formamidase [Alkalihalobacillus alcalophilus ATCC 27647 = CGMCC 1.3604]